MAVRDNPIIFPQLDVLRGFAAISVVVFHVIELTAWGEFPNEGPLRWFRNGWVGVDLFFVISGFVIALSVYSAMRNRPISWRRDFVRKRLARIVPLYCLTSLIFVVFSNPSLLIRDKFWFDVITHLTFIHNLFLSTIGSINGVNWTIATEMQFYLLMLLAAPLIVRLNVSLILIGGVTIAWAWRLLVFVLAANHQIDGSEPTMSMLVTQLPGMADEFAFGMAIAVVMVRFQTSNIVESITSKGALLIVPAIVLVVVSSYWFTSDPTNYWHDPVRVVCSRSALGLSFAMLTLSACGKLPHILNVLLAPFRYLGKISYGIYLWHLPVLLSLKTLPMSHTLILVWGTLLTVVLSAGSWHLFELPILRRYGSNTLHALS